MVKSEAELQMRAKNERCCKKERGLTIGKGERERLFQEAQAWLSPGC